MMREAFEKKFCEIYVTVADTMEALDWIQSLRCEGGYSDTQVQQAFELWLDGTSFNLLWE